MSPSGWDLEVNTANDVRCFSMTHANFLVKSVRRHFILSLHKAVKSFSLLSGFVAGHKRC